MKKFTALSIVALSLSACSLFGGGSGGGDTEEVSEEPTSVTETGPIKIGYIGPLTGDAASYGIDTLNGVTLAVEEINASGGIGGRQIELVAEDGRCTGADAASAAQKLVNVDNVVAIVGGQCSGETLAASPIAEAAGTVLLSPLSSSPDVTLAGDFIFRDYPSDALKTKAMANYLQQEELMKVAAITENTDFAVAFRDSLKENLGEESLVFDEVVEPNTKDFRSLITRLKDVEFDVFFPNGQTPAAVAAMMQQLREQGLEQLAVSHDVAQDSSTIEIGGEAVAGMQAIGVPEVAADSEFGATFLGKFSETQAAMAFAAHAYDAMHVLAEAIGTVGTEGTAIRDYFYDLEGYSGVVGTFAFDANGDVTGIPYVLYEVQDGAWAKKMDISVDAEEESEDDAMMEEDSMEEAMEEDEMEEEMMEEEHDMEGGEEVMEEE